MDRHNNRSNSYQSILLEIPSNPNVLSDLSSAQGLVFRIENPEAFEKITDLKEKLKVKVHEVMKKGLTERQLEVVLLWLSGKTQNEIAKILGINQTSVHKVIKGNIDYKNGKKRYGGALKKISKLCYCDEEVKVILHELQEMYESIEL